jgi:plastocyanin
MTRALVTGMLVIGGCAASALSALPAAAADQTVHAIGAVDGDYGPVPDHFSPAVVRIAPGESVTFVNDAGQHNVRFQDGLFTSPDTPQLPPLWPSPPGKRTFSQSGTYNFLCDMHGALGMKGTVIVGSSTTQPPSTSKPTPAGSPGASPGALHIKSLSSKRHRFCNSGGKRCRRPGVRFEIDLSRSGRVTGKLARRPLTGRGKARRFGALNFGELKPGRTKLSFRRTSAGRRLIRGRYAMTLKAGTDTRTLRFSIVS